MVVSFLWGRLSKVLYTFGPDCLRINLVYEWFANDLNRTTANGLTPDILSTIHRQFDETVQFCLQMIWSTLYIDLMLQLALYNYRCTYTLVLILNFLSDINLMGTSWALLSSNQIFKTCMFLISRTGYLCV